MIKKYSDKELYKISFEKRIPLLDFSTYEVKVACIVSLLLLIVVVCILRHNGNLQLFIGGIRDLVLYATFGLLGVLGFLISGLAIIASSVGKKITKNIITVGNLESLLAVLYSFKYIGTIIGFQIISFVIAYILLYVESKLYTSLFLIYFFVTSYLFVFTVFYIISLLRTCIDVFILSYNYSELEVNTSDIE